MGHRDNNSREFLFAPTSFYPLQRLISKSVLPAKGWFKTRKRHFSGLPI